MYSVELKENGGKGQHTFSHMVLRSQATERNETIREYARWQQQTVDDYKERSCTDVLTGLKNRRYYEEVIAGVGH